VARPPSPVDFDAVGRVAELTELAHACDRDAIRRRLVELLPDHDARFSIDV
jgi:hypothetical protein